MIPAGDRPKQPIELAMDGGESCAEIRVGQGASVTIVDASTSAVHAVNVFLEPESELFYICIARTSSLTLRSTVGQGASMHWHCTTVGASVGHSLVSTCDGPDAVSDIDWIFRVRGAERQSVSVRNIFAARSGGGEITMKGVAEGTGMATCNGMIEITERGKGTNTYLTQDVLMLDRTAKVDAVPGLEIRTNDVKASHSATVSQVTAEDLFYLQSRGIEEATARAMFVEGFLIDLTERIADAAVRERIEVALQSA